MVDDFIKTKIGSMPFITLTARELDRGDKNKTRSIDKVRWTSILGNLKSRGVKPVVIRDTAMAFEQPMFDGIIEVPVASVHLPFRIALYEKALMNFTRNSGPSTMLLYGKSNSMFFNEFDEDFLPVSEKWFFDHYGMTHGSQFPMTTTRTDFIWDPERLDKISEKIENLITSHKTIHRLHAFSNKENANASFMRALKHLIKCIKSEVLPEDAKLLIGLKKLNAEYELGVNAEEILNLLEVEKHIPPSTLSQLKTYFD